MKRLALQALLIALFITLNFLTSCKNPAHNHQPGEIIRLDTIVASGDVVSGVSNQTVKEALAIYMQILGAAPEMPVEQSVDSIRNTHWFQLFEADTQPRSDMFKDAEVALGKVNSYISSSFDSIAPISYFGIVSPYRQQIIIDGKRVYIVLNHYLGADYPGYAGLPEYARALKSPSHIAPDVTEALLASNYPLRLEDDATTLNRLLYDGALAWCITQATGLTIGELIGWNEDEAQFVSKNESHIWAELIKRDLLYSTDPTIAARLIEPSPSTAILSPQLPGRVGRYIGYRIVEDYLRNNKLTPQQLLSPDFYNNPLTLINSGYHG